VGRERVGDPRGNAVHIIKKRPGPTGEEGHGNREKNGKRGVVTVRTRQRKEELYALENSGGGGLGGGHGGDLDVLRCVEAAGAGRSGLLNSDRGKKGFSGEMAESRWCRGGGPKYTF